MKHFIIIVFTFNFLLGIVSSGETCTHNCSGCKKGRCDITGCPDGGFCCADIIGDYGSCCSGCGKIKLCATNCFSCLDGVCTGCKKGFWGANCERSCDSFCPNGCDQLLGKCEYCGNCINGECDSSDICLKGCKEGWSGNKCDKSNYDENLAKNLLYYAAASYCQKQDVALSSWTCRPCKASGLQILPGRDPQIIIIRSTIKYSDAVIAIDYVNSRVVISFSGSMNSEQILDEILQYLKFGLVSYRFIQNVKVNKYFSDAYFSLMDRLEYQIGDILKANPQFQIHFTGHSLGGAVAVLAAATMANHKIIDSEKVKIYTFGEPRLGDLALSNYINKTFKHLYRVVHYLDPVAHVPPCQTDSNSECIEGNHYHEKTEVFYNLKMNSYRICDGKPTGEDSTCSDKNASQGIFNIDYHLSYFGYSLSKICDADNPCEEIKTCDKIRSADCGWCPSRNEAYPIKDRLPQEPFECPADEVQGQWTIAEYNCKCLTATTCKDISNTDCGWCPSRKKAYLGTAKGPNDGITCPATAEEGQWTIKDYNCKCINATNCQDIANTDCGWCPSNKKAYYGDKLGPFDKIPCQATHEDGQWTMNSYNCPCITATKCEDLASTDCGWCPSRGKGYFGDNKGPFDGLSCPANDKDGQWTKQVYNCKCLNAQKCDDIKGTDCGWCPSKRKAYLGDNSGPSFGITCPPTQEDGSWTAQTYHCKCLSATKCEDISRTDCGWCPSLNKAYLGDNNGPIGLQCPATQKDGQWISHDYDCKCITATKCEEISRSDCGWCYDTNKAYLGNVSGPFGLSCSNENWITDLSKCRKSSNFLIEYE